MANAIMETNVIFHMRSRFSSQLGMMIEEMKEVTTSAEMIEDMEDTMIAKTIEKMIDMIIGTIQSMTAEMTQETNMNNAIIMTREAHPVEEQEVEVVVEREAQEEHHVDVAEVAEKKTLTSATNFMMMVMNSQNLTTMTIVAILAQNSKTQISKRGKTPIITQIKSLQTFIVMIAKSRSTRCGKQSQRKSLGISTMRNLNTLKSLNILRKDLNTLKKNIDTQRIDMKSQSMPKSMPRSLNIAIASPNIKSLNILKKNPNSLKKMLTNLTTTATKSKIMTTMGKMVTSNMMKKIMILMILTPTLRIRTTIALQ